MTRAERLKQAHAALLLGFADGCRRAKRYEEARAFAQKALDVWPDIYADVGREDAVALGLHELYGAGATQGEFASDDTPVST